MAKKTVRKTVPKRKRKPSVKPAPAAPMTVQAAPVAPAETKPPAPAKEVKAAKLREELHVFFDLRDGSYLSKLNGRFVSMKKNDLTMRFRALGLRDDIYTQTETAGSLREIDFPFYAAQNLRMIDFAGPVAGRRTGMFTDSAGRKFLVTDEAGGVWDALVSKAKPKFFPAFMEELLPGDQCDHNLFWLAEAIRSMRAVDFSPGQACFFAGERGCGKSFLQYCITELLGGRAANPFEYLMGEKFNKDLAGAEHWMVEDPGTSTDIRTRREFGAKIKEATVNRDLRINGKGKDAGLLQIFRRVTISINNEKEELAVAPPMVEGVADKINLYSCAKVVKSFDPFRDATGKVDRARLWAAFMGEVHAVRSWLLQNYSKIPKDQVDERFGIRAFHHPDILSELSSMTYESRFLELLDELYFSDSEDGVATAVEKKSAEIQKELLDKNRFEAEKVLRYPGQCGSHLGKLTKSAPDRVSKRMLDGHALWTINPPSKSQVKE